jgi:hypothetical protein
MAATRATREWDSMLNERETSAVDNVYCNINNPISRQFCDDDFGTTNASLSRGSMNKVIDFCIQYGANPNQTIADSGCNNNLSIVHFAHKTKIKCLVIEISPIWCKFAAVGFLDAIRCKQGKKPLLNTKVSLACEDLYRFHSFPTIDWVYMFDEEFEETLMDHLMKAYANAKSIKHVLSFKVSKRQSYHKRFIEHGFEKIDKLDGLKKEGSEEHNKLYLYKRVKEVTVVFEECRVKPPQYTDQKVIVSS